MQMDLQGALSHGLFNYFHADHGRSFDNMGVLIGLSQKAGFMKEDGKIENLDRALITDSVSTMASAVLGSTTATSYLECAVGGRRRPNRPYSSGGDCHTFLFCALPCSSCCAGSLFCDCLADCGRGINDAGSHAYQI